MEPCQAPEPVNEEEDDLIDLNPPAPASPEVALHHLTMTSLPLNHWVNPHTITTAEEDT